MKILLKLKKSHKGIIGKEFTDEYDLKYSSHREALIEQLVEIWEDKRYYDIEDDREKIDEIIDLLSENRIDEIKDYIIEFGDYDLFLDRI